MTLTPEQRITRQTGVGGSDAAVILGISTRKTVRELYHEKRGELPQQEGETDDQWWGRMLEPIVRQRFSEVSGLTILMPKDTLRHPEHDWMLANVDGIAVDTRLVTLERFGQVIDRGYEGKTAFYADEWGEEDTDEVPKTYLLQCHHYLTVTGFPVWDVAALVGRQFRTYEVLADKEMSEMLIEAEREFMERVRAGEPPEMDYRHRTALEAMRKIYRGTNGARLVATEDICDIRAKLHEAQERQKTATADIEECKAQLLDFMGEAALLEFPDGRCYRRQETSRAGYTVGPSTHIDFRIVNDPNKARKGGRRK